MHHHMANMRLYKLSEGVPDQKGCCKTILTLEVEFLGQGEEYFRPQVEQKKEVQGPGG